MRRGAHRERGAASVVGTRAVGARALLLAVALVALVVSVVVLAAGCDMPSTGGLGQVGGSGNLVTRTYDFSGFTRVEVGSGFDVTIDYADSPLVSVTVDGNLVEEHLKVELDGDTLRIGLASLWQYHDVTLKATVTLPSLAGLEASGASTLTASGFASGDPLDLGASGASTVTLSGVRAGNVTADVSGASRVEGELEAQELGGDVSGASTVTLTGAASRLTLGASGGSRFDLPELTAQDAELELSGGSRGTVLVTGSLSVDASGGSRVEYAGSPQLGSIDTSGGSAVEPAGE
jgi:hypothetical protein